MGADVSCVPSYASIPRPYFLRLFVSSTAIIDWKSCSPSSHKFVPSWWRNLDNLRSFLRTSAKLFFKGIGNSLTCAFYKEMRLRNVYIGLLLDYILFVSLTFVIYYGDQSIETVRLAGIPSQGSWVGLLYFGWCKFLSRV